MRIVIALDGSPIGESALDVAGDWARKTGAELNLVTVIDPDDVHETAAGGAWHAFTPGGTATGQALPTQDPAPRYAEDRSQAFTTMRTGAEAMLRDLAERHLDGIEAKVGVEFYDDTAEGIVNAVRETDADLVIMGTRGRGGIGRALLGSVAETVVRESPVPVVLVGPAMRSRLTSSHADDATPPMPPSDGAPAEGSDAPTQAQEAEERARRVKGAETETLVDWLAAPDWQLRRQAREELIDRDAVDALTGATRRRHGDIRWSAAKALRELRDERSVPALIDLLEDQNPSVRWTAAEALHAIGKPSVAPILRRLLTNPGSVWLHEGAHHVLQPLVEPSFSPVVDALEGPYPSITVPPKANEALKKLEGFE